MHEHNSAKYVLPTQTLTSTSFFDSTPAKQNIDDQQPIPFNKRASISPKVSQNCCLNNIFNFPYN